MANKHDEKKKWPSYTMVAQHMKRIYFHFYKATYQKTDIDRKTKELIAIAVSAVHGCSYCADAHSAVCRQLGLSEKGLVEAACVIDLFAVLSTLAKGFRLGKRNF